MAGTASTTTSTGATDAFAPILKQMQDLQAAQLNFNLENQKISAAMTASSATTNLITSAHQAAGNAAKSIGQNMVDSSRR
jgi:hypothetical protein